MHRRAFILAALVAPAKRGPAARLVALMNRCSEKWNELANEMNEGKIFDVKKAKELSKRFHQLENSGEWPS